MIEWFKGLPYAITVCDLQGIILEMNEKAAETFQKYGGAALIGTSLLECHPEPARSKLVRLLDSGEQNIYTIEKNGIRKLICQTPWFQNNKRCGMVELSIEIPQDMPHFQR